MLTPVASIALAKRYRLFCNTVKRTDRSGLRRVMLRIQLDAYAGPFSLVATGIGMRAETRHAISNRSDTRVRVSVSATHAA